MRTLLIALSLLIGSQSLASSRPQDRPCIGLALSGGGALGLAHIGVLKVLEQEGIPIDVVSGTSMGSVIGALYSIGYTSPEIERIALSTDWMDLFSDRLSRTELAMKSRKKEERYLLSFPIAEGRPRLPAGLIGGQKIYDLFVRLAWPALEVEDFRALARPFACVATDIEKGEAVVFTRGYLPDAMRASMAIPSVFAPIRIGGRLLADGGIVRNLPASDARMLGAEVVIGVDVAAELAPAGELKSLLEILDRSFEIARRPEALRQRELCTVIIEPNLANFRSIDYLRAEEIIRAGEEAARSSISAIKAAIDSAWESEQRDFARKCLPDTIEQRDLPPPPGANYPVSVAEIEIRGLKDVSERFAMAELGLHTPGNLASIELQKSIRRLFGSGYFSSIRYKFEKSPSGRKLVVIVEEAGNISLNAGLRYDSHWGASLLLDALAKNILEHGSLLELELLLGNRKHAASEYSIHTGIKRSFGARLDMEWNEDHIDEYTGLDRRSRWKASSLRSGFYLESFLSRVLYLGAGVNSEWFRISPEIAPVETGEIKDNMLFFRADLWIDTLDRLWFTRKGTMIKLRSEARLPHSGNDGFERSLCLARLAVPVHKKLTLRSDLFAGTSSGRKLPFHYRYFPGGENSWIVFDGERNLNFHGYEHQEFQGRHAFFASLSLQVEPARGWYIELASNAGNAVEECKNLFDRSLIYAGYGAALGAETPAGPVKIVLSYSERRKLGLFLDAGFPF